MASHHAAVRGSSLQSASTTKTKLDCGTSPTTLSRLRDYDSGESGALATMTVQKLRGHIARCDHCRHYLAQLDRLHTQLSAMNNAYVAETEATTGWLDNILSAISLEVSRGELIALPPWHLSDTLGIYEGALRAIARRVASSGPMIISSTHIEFIDPQTSALRINLEAYASYPCNIMEQANWARQRVLDELAQQNDLNVHEVNLEVVDIIISTDNDTSQPPANA